MQPSSGAKDTDTLQQLKAISPSGCGKFIKLKGAPWGLPRLLTHFTTSDIASTRV